MIGRKDDGTADGLPVKDRWDLLPLGAVRAIIRVLMHGSAKYGDNNWRAVTDHRRRYYAAALRHLTAWHEGERDDVESGMSHLAHAGCCVLFLLARDGEAPSVVPIEETLPIR